MVLVNAGYGLAIVAYAVLLAFLVVGRRLTWPFNYLALFSGFMTLWAAGLLWSAQRGVDFGGLIVIESLHATGALLFLGQLIGRGGTETWRRGFAWLPWLLPPFAIGIYAWSATSGKVGFESVYYFIVLVSLAGLLATEQIYRNSGLLRRGVSALVAVAFGTLFVFDLYTYSNALLVAGLSDELWAARGFVSALVVPLLMLAIKREPEWQGRLFVSRQVVFYTTSLVGVGLYLLLVAFGSVIIQRLGGDWGAALRVVFLVATLAVLVLVLFSQQVRRRAKVFLATHFYANRYDYREQWLRLIRRLAQDSQRAPMPELCLNALADVIDSDGGVLWLRDPDGAPTWYDAALFGERTGDTVLTDTHPLAEFMARTGWVVDGLEVASDPAHYDDVFDPAADPVVTAQRIFVPLVLDGELRGIACLNRPPGLPALNFEDHDLLQTVGQQLAVFLQRDRNREQLAEAREFEVFNRFTAFIMHDIKNLIAQLSLVVENAEKHKSNPEFVDDAMATISNSVRRMTGLLAQLQADDFKGLAKRFDIREALVEAIEGTEPREPRPRLETSGEGSMEADRERFVTALEHLIRNAQDACKGADGSVTVSLSLNGATAGIEVADTGVGMSEAFIRDRLFRPFDSTRGAQGMGIGAYQAREFVQSIGGALTVSSQPDQGTSIRIEVPTV